MADKSEREMKALSRELVRMSMIYPRAMMAAMYEEASDIFSESQKMVPVDTGRLRSSGLVMTSIKGAALAMQSFKIVVSYGTKYALAVHERTKNDQGRQDRAELALSNPGYKPKHGTTGRSKYLSIPFDEAAPNIQQNIIRATKHYIRSGVPPAAGETIKSDQKVTPKKRRKRKRKKAGDEKKG